MNLLKREDFEIIDELLTELREHALEGTPIIVEGADDVRALSRLGIDGCVHKISSGNSLLNFIEGFSGSGKVIILTDFDRTGERLAKFFLKHAKRLGMEPVTKFRDKLKSLVRKNVKDIEGLAKFLQHQRAALG